MSNQAKQGAWLVAEGAVVGFMAWAAAQAIVNPGVVDWLNFAGAVAFVVSVMSILIACTVVALIDDSEEAGG